jgi:hypothetical protein
MEGDGVSLQPDHPHPGLGYLPQMFACPIAPRAVANNVRFIIAVFMKAQR